MGWDKWNQMPVFNITRPKALGSLGLAVKEARFGDESGCPPRQFPMTQAFYIFINGSII
jgi:hypothetical protein